MRGQVLLPLGLRLNGRVGRWAPAPALGCRGGLSPGTAAPAPSARLRRSPPSALVVPFIPRQHLGHQRRCRLRSGVPGYGVRCPAPTFRRAGPGGLWQLCPSRRAAGGGSPASCSLCAAARPCLSRRCGPRVCHSRARGRRLSCAVGGGELKLSPCRCGAMSLCSK